MFANGGGQPFVGDQKAENNQNTQNFINMKKLKNTTETPMTADPLLGTVDFSKITLCPALEYKCYCQIAGHCEYCSNFHTNKGETCKGCGANFKDKSLNTKAKYENNKF